MDLLVPLLTSANIATYVAVMNFVAFAAFGLDKMAARAGAWRISESKLLGLALFGGSPGAFAGRHLFRHKTHKQPFSGELRTIAVLQIVALAAFLAWQVYGGAEPR